MNFDFASELGAVTREVLAAERDGQASRAVVLSRSYATTVEDLWDAVTNRERLPCWFLPVEGELEPGGRYQLKGNAGGAIRVCEPPSLLALTWEFGDFASRVEVRFSDDGAARARLALTHSAPLSEHWETYGPGATGIGWELALMGLGIHLASPTAPRPDEGAFAASPDGRAFIAGSGEAWGRAAVAAGEDPGAAESAARKTTAFYTGETG